MKEYTAKEILFENQMDEYAQIIYKYPISHEYCMIILKVIAEVQMKTALSGDQIADDIKKLYFKELTTII